MAVTSSERKEALAAAAEQELRALEARGVRMDGSGFSPVVLVKGELNNDEMQGGKLLGGADGRALRRGRARSAGRTLCNWLAA